jgi:hypothetical protein
LWNTFKRIRQTAHGGGSACSDGFGDRGAFFAEEKETFAKETRLPEARRPIRRSISLRNKQPGVQ